jgi:HSP20 family protein
MDLVPSRRGIGTGLARLRNEMDDLFGRFFGDWGMAFPERGTYWPAMDVSEDKDAITVKAELPGMTADDINISVQGNTLSITGEKKEETEEKKEGYYHSERRFGSFRRDLMLPSDVDASKVDAAYREGVLTITLPKTEQAKAKTVKVKT